MFKRLHLDSDELALALVLWICALPLIAFNSNPIFRIQSRQRHCTSFDFCICHIVLGHFPPANVQGSRRPRK